MLNRLLRVCLVGLFFLISLSGFAQKGMSITLFGMPQRTFMYSKPEGKYFVNYGEILKKPSYNFAFGFLMKYYINKIFVIGYGLQAGPHIQKYSTYRKPNISVQDFSISLRYIKIPFLLQCNYVVKEKYKLFFSCAPQLNILIAENGGIPVYIDDNFFFIDPGGVYHNFLLAGVINAGGEFKLDNKISFTISANFEGNISSVEKRYFQEVAPGTKGDSYKIFEYPAMTIKSKHNIVLGISLGLTFRIGNPKL